ncbi:hypothetical protein GGTG_10172 [Gaeumannomyces tritici R3-111a-1]|uniref:Homeobox domain-containing protein n=1 Tax=Gaeumannomyces tritici (strain R3-111a-1) TaxID=644352 RepID=J3P9J2_GAET3|nr:hypothetical protein GGTG_10172 [Gaeumannomyces tritici R3-111a-1]EJT73328.1 hypothetical protein GGTG_10172 [Gaeumannomyces tritici R3-111a-1]
MDYANMFRNRGHQPGYLLPQYGAAAPTVQQQHGQQRYPLHQHHQQQQQQPQHPYHVQLQLQHQQHPQAQHRQFTPQRPPTQGFSFPYTNEQLLVLAQMQQQRTMLNQAQAAANASPQTKQEQPKPRLAKDEVELLEKEFQKNQKPSSGRKREIADILKVDQPRINNWFQNRRAKEKGIKKTQEFAARRAAEQHDLSEAGSTRSPDTDAEGVGSEYFDMENQSQHSGRPSSAPFPEPRQEAELTEDTPPADEFSYASPVGQSLQPSIENSDSCGNGVKEEYPSPDSLPFQPSDTTADSHFTPHASVFAPGLESQGEYQDEFSGQAEGVLPRTAMQDNFSMSSFLSPRDQDQLPFSYHQFAPTTGPDSILAPTPSFPSQLLGRLELHEIKEEEEQQSQAALEMNSEHDSSSAHQAAADNSIPLLAGHARQQISSPNPTVMSPPTPDDLRFKSPPPPSNIASRRNKGVPAQLNATALRAYSYGPKTGLDMSKRSDAASPGIRRIASATGPTMPGRIQKSLSCANIGGSGAPRSPLTRERTKDALMRSLQSTVAAVRSPVLGGSIAGNVMSPMTPSGEYFGTGGASAMASTQGTREATVASSASDEEQSYGIGAPPSAMAGGFFTGTLKTPPGTPGLNGVGGTGFQEHQMAPGQINTFEAAWNFNPQDEPLVTPGLGSFGSEEFAMASSAPGYIGSSQPPTPSFPHSIGPASFGAYPWSATGPSVVPYSGSAGMMHGGGIAEYTFPESFVPDSSARSSPGLPPKSSKQFQFTQNVTPQDFSEK